MLPRGRENTRQDARATLRKLSVLNRNPYIGYLPKEPFRQVLQTRDANTATLRPFLWIKMCMKREVNLLRRFAGKIIRCAAPVPETTPNLLPEAAKDAQNLPILLSADLKQTPALYTYALFVCNKTHECVKWGCEVFLPAHLCYETCLIQQHPAVYGG